MNDDKPANESMSLEQRMASVGDCVTVALDTLIPRSQGPEGRLMSAMRYAALGGGKFVRPYLLIETGRLFDVEERCLLRAAAAVECIHAYSLIHDDLPAMDDDDIRRGRPSTHIAFDEATAILAGDGLQALAFEILVDPQTHADPNVRLALVEQLSRASGCKGMVGGQMMDMTANELGNDLAAVTRMQRLKTGAIIHAAVMMGAIMGRAGEKTCQHLGAYAHDIGLLFQITDDLLDVEGDPERMGKRANKDSEHGKATFVSLMGVEGAKEHISLLRTQAIGHLAQFGERGHWLSGLADALVDRQH